MTIHLIGGPLDGIDYELIGRMMPAEIQLPNERLTVRHRYELRDDCKTADYVRDEPIYPEEQRQLLAEHQRS
jgi:hypothetical protein